VQVRACSRKVCKAFTFAVPMRLHLQCCCPSAMDTHPVCATVRATPRHERMTLRHQTLRSATTTSALCSFAKYVLTCTEAFSWRSAPDRMLSLGPDVVGKQVSFSRRASRSALRASPATIWISAGAIPTTFRLLIVDRDLTLTLKRLDLHRWRVVVRRGEDLGVLDRDRGVALQTCRSWGWAVVGCSTTARLMPRAGHCRKITAPAPPSLYATAWSPTGQIPARPGRRSRNVTGGACRRGAQRRADRRLVRMKIRRSPHIRLYRSPGSACPG
jgi:hypothetical protein